MSDSESEFESADEGSKSSDGWKVDDIFDMPNVKQEFIETKSFELPSLSTKVDTEPSKCEFEAAKNLKQNVMSDTIPTLKSRIDRIKINNDNTNSEQQVPEESKNEIKSNDAQSNNSWGGWSSGWNVNSFISTASALTNQVSQSITNVIGAPAPEQLASVDCNKVDIFHGKSTNELPESVLDTSYFLSNVSQITKIVETTGSKIISGSLDTFEKVGKKTLEVLQEGDPGLRKKRALFFQNTEKINLSQVLQEAKEKSEIESKQNNQSEVKKGYTYLLDHFQGLIYLESLELLSKQCQMKLQTVLLSYSGPQLTDIQNKLEEIKELCYFDCDDDEKLISDLEFKRLLTICINKINSEVKTEKILKISSFIDIKSNEEFNSEDNIHNEAISALAELTAAAMELYYKLGESLMINTQNQEVIIIAENLSLLNEAICCRIRSIANTFACLLTAFDATDTSNNISDIYLEASNSSSYIQDAAQLLFPILQLIVI